MKNQDQHLQLIELPGIVLYGPGNNSIEGLKSRLVDHGARYLADSAEYIVDNTSWVFCDELSWEARPAGNGMVIRYRAEGGNPRHTIVTNDTFYIEYSEEVPPIE